MNKQYIAHIREKDGEIQPLIDHIREVGDLACEFAQKINTPDAGNVLGLLHDFSPSRARAWQKYSRSEKWIQRRMTGHEKLNSNQSKFIIAHSCPATLIRRVAGRTDGN